MKITLRQLYLFVLTAKHQTVSAAAKEASLSQAATSMSLAQLEHLLGQSLFDREGRKLTLNTLGKQILPQAHEIIQKTHELERAVTKPNNPTGHIRIGASTTLANHILPPMINAFRKKYPDISLELTAFNTENCIRELLNFNIDTALVEGLYLHPNIEFKPWTTDQLQIVCHPKHPLAKKTAINPKLLSQYPWILREPASGTRQVLNAVLQQHNVILNDTMVVNSSEAIKNLIQSNPLVLSCLSKSILADDLKAKKLAKLTIKSWSLQRPFYYARHKLKTDTHATQLFEDYVWSIV